MASRQRRLDIIFLRTTRVRVPLRRDRLGKDAQPNFGRVEKKKDPLRP